MRITLRERKKGNRIVLYLDYYQKGFRKTEYLDLFLTPDPEKGKLSRAEQDRNKEIRRMAEQICHQKNIDYNSGKFSIFDIKKQKTLLLAYFESLLHEKSSSLGNSGNWSSMLKHLKEYCHPGYTFENVNEKFLEGFKAHLNKAKKSNGNPLSQNSKVSYFNKLLAGLKQAKKEGILNQYVNIEVEGFKQAETQRGYLTLEELGELAKAECEIPILKKAFLFSCLTGIRFGDLQKLSWDQIEESESMGCFIKFTQSKTKAPENLPISNQALEMLGPRDPEDGAVFPFLHYSAWTNVKLESWKNAAGIKRKVTFHMARHTHAVLQLSMGTDIFTVSKLLGHKSLKTTQIYAKVMDSTKRTAADKIVIKNLSKDGNEL